MSKTLTIHKQAFDDILYFTKNDLKVVKKTFELIDDIQKNPFEGLGKPEALKYKFNGCWSRRITLEHRLVYLITDKEIVIFTCRFPYE